MRILAIDTATEACSVALWNNGTINAHFELCPQEHTQRILPMVQEILAASGLSLNEIDALAFGRGGQLYRRAYRHWYCARAGVRGKSADDRCFDACHDGAGRVA